MVVLLIYPIVFLIILLSVQNKRKHFFYTLILAIALFSSIAACYLYQIDLTYSSHHIELEFVLIHVVCLLLLIKSFKNYDRIMVTGILKAPPFIENSLCIIFITLSIVAISVSIPNIDINRMLFDSEELRHILEEERDISYLSYFGMKYWTISLALAFYNIVFYPNRKFLIFLLIISSLSTVLDGMIVAAREYLIKYLFLSFVLYYWLKDYINARWKKYLKVSAIVIGTSATVFVLLITIARFGSNSSQDTTVINSILSYFGQGFLNFSEYCHGMPNGRSIGGSSKFPFFAGYPSGSLVVNTHTNVFATCVGSWVSDVGIIWAILITLIYSIIFRIIGKLRITIFTLIYVSWVVEFSFSIIFFHNDVLNGSRVISIFLIVLFDIFTRNLK